MKKSELYILSIAQVGNSLNYNVLLLFLPIYWINNIFYMHPLKYTLGFLIVTISFALGTTCYIFVGYLSDRTRTRLGRRRPYLLMVIPSAIFFMFLGVPDVLIELSGGSIISLFIILAICASIYAVTFRFLNCSYFSLYMDLTTPEERVFTSVVFNLFGMLGTLVAFLLIPFMLEGANLPFFIVTTICGLIYLTTVLIAFFLGPKEDLEKIKRLDDEGYKPEKFLTTLKAAIKDKNFSYYLIGGFFFSLAFAFFLLLLMPYLEFKNISFLSILIFLIPVATISVIIINKLAEKWGKLKTFKLGLGLGIIIQPFLVFLGVYGTELLIFIQVVIMICVILFIVLNIISFSLAVLMDITPEGKEATYSGIYLFCTVYATPIASAICGITLDFFNFPVLYWQDNSFGYILLILIASLAYLLSFLAIRKVKY